MQEGAGVYVLRMDINIVSDVVQEEAGWPLQPAVYDIIWIKGLQKRARGHNI
jgi:hypothetical protein